MNAPIIIPRTPYVLRAPPGAPHAGIGIDPGKDGAIVLTVGTEIRWAIWWKPAQQAKRQGFRSWFWEPGEHVAETWATTWTWATDWTCTLPDGPDVVATVEAVHGQPGKSGFEVLAEYAGRALAWCEQLELAIGDRPTSTTWRADLLKLPSSTKADVAEQVAIDTLLGHSSGGRSITIARPFTGPLLPDISGHVAEAALMALWGRGYRAQPETVTAPGKRGARWPKPS